MPNQVVQPITPAMFEAAAIEIQKIAYGVAKSKMRAEEVPSKLAGHWASRVLQAAFRAQWGEDLTEEIKASLVRELTQEELDDMQARVLRHVRGLPVSD